jgi:hypothetical protein
VLARGKAVFVVVPETHLATVPTTRTKPVLEL